MKHTQDATEKENLRLALDAMRVREWVPLVGFPSWQQPLCLLVGADPLLPMEGPGPGVRATMTVFTVSHLQDLAQCVNEVKRDNETLRQITNFQLSIENLVRGGARWAKGVDPRAGS